MKSRGLAFVVSGPSGVGKGTLVRRLMDEFPNIKFSISYTTRKPRKGEQHGIDYFFVEKEEFEALINKNFFVEWAIVHTNYYGTPRQEIEKKLAKGFDVIFDIDVQGARKLRQNLKDGVFVFILPPSIEELRRRLENRSTDTHKSIEIRLKNAKKEMNAAREFDFVVINDELEKAYETLRCIYLAQKCKVREE
jgi:guanylate kinase